MAGSITISTLNNDTGVLATQNGMTGIAKAWVTYNGVAQTITASFNVSSVTYNGTGDYTINYTTAMPSANYTISTAGGDLTTSGRTTGGYSNATRLTTSCRVLSFNAVQSAVTNCDAYYFSALAT
jgi:hypothetical protein